MNDDSSAIEALIPDYAGQQDASARQRSDQQTRALVGEMLSAIRGRFPTDGLGARLDELIERCQFGDARVFNALEDARLGESPNAQQIAAAERDLVLLARRLTDAEPAAAGPLLDRLRAAFERHDQLILTLGQARVRPPGR